MRLLVIVPYRDREEHLPVFAPYLAETLAAQNVNYCCVVVEQSPGKLFNRGLLCNIGFAAFAAAADYVCIHDVDLIGENFDYTYSPVVTHLSAMARYHDYKEYYARCLGGVVLFPKTAYIKVNGFSNEYWGWGCEDDDLRLRCDVAELTVARRPGKFYSLPHERIASKDRAALSPGYIANKERLTQFRAAEDQAAIMRQDGLTTIQKYCNTLRVTVTALYTMLHADVK